MSVAHVARTEIRLNELRGKLQDLRTKHAKRKALLDTCQASFMQDVMQELRFLNGRIARTLELISIWEK
jgi:hypothetical protein